MTDKIQVNLRLPQEVIEQLKNEAKNLLEVIIDEYLQKQKSQHI